MVAVEARQTPEPASNSSHMLAGAGAGFIATALLHPLDLIKTRMHVQEIGGRRLPHYANLWQAFRSIVRLEGAAGLYQGVGPNVVGSTLSWAMYMFLYNGLKVRLTARAERAPPEQRWSPSLVYVTSATASGVMVSLIMHPVFTIKTRMQLQLAAPVASPAATAPAQELAHLVPMAQRDNYASGLVAARRIIREEGIVSLYRGIGPSLLLVSHGAVQFLGYEHLKSFFGRLNSLSSLSDGAPRETKLTGAQLTASAIGSKVVATLATYPYQVVRSILQQRAVVGDDALHSTTVSGTVRHLWRTERLRGFYRGIVPHILRSTPQASITLVAYEYLHRIIIREG